MKYLDNEEIAKAPCGQETIVTEFSDLLLIVLHAPVEGVSYAFHNFTLQVLPGCCISSMHIKFAAPGKVTQPKMSHKGNFVPIIMLSSTIYYICIIRVWYVNLMW